MLKKDEVGGGVLYVGGWDAAEDISGLQAAGVSEYQILIFNKKKNAIVTYDNEVFNIKMTDGMIYHKTTIFD